MAPVQRPFSEAQLATREANLRALELAHRLVSILFYGMIGAAIVQFVLRLVLDRGTFSTNLLTGAIYCTFVAAVCFIAMLIMGIIGRSQED